MGVGPKVANDVVLGELGWWTMKGRRDLAKLRFWGKILNVADNRLIRIVYQARRAEYLRYKDGQFWCKEIHQLLLSLGLGRCWDNEETGNLNAWMTVVHNQIAQREEKEWLIRISEKPKLRLYMRIKDQLCEEEYLNLGDSWTRRLLTNLRAGSSELQIEIGRRQNEPLESRTCRICVKNVIEDEGHFLLYCPMYDRERKDMFDEILEHTEEKFDLRVMLHDAHWMLDVLVGHSFIQEKTREVVMTAVLRYLRQAFNRRKQFIRQLYAHSV